MNALRAVSTTPTAAARLREYRNQLAELSAEGGERAQRIAALEGLLRDAEASAARVTELRAARQRRAGELIATGKAITLRAEDDAIAAAVKRSDSAQAEVTALDGSDSVRAAIAYLNDQQREAQSYLGSFQAQAPRLLRDVVDERLHALAPRLKTVLAELVEVLTDIGATGLIYDKLSARIPGSTGSASGAVQRLEIGILRHPAFADFAGMINIAGAIQTRSAIEQRKLETGDG